MFDSAKSETQALPNPDFLIRDSGTTWALCPLTPEAKRWTEENVHLESWQWLGATFVVDWRYGALLVGGISGAGFQIA
jgi:hypothetical protein